jgi:calcium-dependent protein kinase
MANELDVLARTDHPHIVRVHELIEDANNFYIVSELMNGGELYHKIVQEKKFSEKNSMRFIKEIVLALNYMH